MPSVGASPNTAIQPDALEVDSTVRRPHRPIGRSSSATQRRWHFHVDVAREEGGPRMFDHYAVSAREVARFEAAVRADGFWPRIRSCGSKLCQPEET